MGLKDSYTSASAFPVKLFHNDVVAHGAINPVHVQIIPTNACNLNCEFCSCSDRDKQGKIDFPQMLKVLDILSVYGTKALTITGGGEPLLYKEINEMMAYAGKRGMEVGLVTNGTQMPKLQPQKNLTWSRISSSDDRTLPLSQIEEAVLANPNTDWAFSHVLTTKPNYEALRELIDFANAYEFSHVRVVPDLFHVDEVPAMDEVRKQMGGRDDIVIYQDRSHPTKGAKECKISLLKPVIAPEGVFPCCGAQYAIHGSDREMIERMKMGEIDDLQKILDEQKPFDGTVCDTCYYDDYNRALAQMTQEVKHKRFV